MVGRLFDVDHMEEDELGDNYSEELWEDRQKRRGHYWKIEDEEEEEE